MLNKEILDKEILDKDKEKRKGGKNYIIFINCAHIIEKI